MSLISIMIMGLPFALYDPSGKVNEVPLTTEDAADLGPVDKIRASIRRKHQLALDSLPDFFFREADKLSEEAAIYSRPDNEVMLTINFAYTEYYESIEAAMWAYGEHDSPRPPGTPNREFTRLKRLYDEYRGKKPSGTAWVAYAVFTGSDGEKLMVAPIHLIPEERTQLQAALDLIVASQ